MNKNQKVQGQVSLMDGAEALPRRSGDLVFHDSWEKRAFAIAVTLCEAGYYNWDDFRDRLITEIGASGESATNPILEQPGYYEHWLASLEQLLEEKVLSVSE